MKLFLTERDCLLGKGLIVYTGVRVLFLDLCFVQNECRRCSIEERESIVLNA